MYETAGIAPFIGHRPIMSWLHAFAGERTDLDASGDLLGRWRSRLRGDETEYCSVGIGGAGPKQPARTGRSAAR
jgi:hypothetical protein